MSVSRTALMSTGGLLVLSACAVPTLSEADLFETAVMSTVEALASLPPMTATSIPTATPSSTPTNTPTLAPTATFTPLSPMIRVSAATNCRTGPDASYRFVAAFQPGQVVEVAAVSTVENYWYIESPNDDGQFCWLWGEYATLDGETDDLPVLTPPALPTPRIDFTLYFYGFYTKCGNTKLVLSVVNNSVTTFQTGQIYIEDLTDSRKIHERVDLHPFAPGPSRCPPGHDNYFPPGAGAYIVSTIEGMSGGHDGRATIKLCTDNHLGGDCITKFAYFRSPD